MGAQSLNVLPAAGLDLVPGHPDEQRHWFAVFTRSHHEKRVAQYYRERNIEHLCLYLVSSVNGVIIEK